MAITTTPGRYDAALKQWVAGTEVTKTTHVGRVFRVYRADYQAMSDVYTLATFADVINDDGSLDRILVNANFECDVSGGRAEVDATYDALLAHACWAEAQAIKEANALAERKALEAEKRRQAPERGKKMVVTKGTQKGLTGTVAYVSGARVLLKDDAVWQDRQANGTWHRASSLGLRA